MEVCCTCVFWRGLHSGVFGSGEMRVWGDAGGKMLPLDEGLKFPSGRGKSDIPEVSARPGV